MSEHNYQWQYSIEEMILRITRMHPVQSVRDHWDSVYVIMRAPGMGETFDLAKLEHLVMLVEADFC